MKKNIHRINVPLIISRIILCCSCLILINCIGKTDFERNITFENGWQQTSNVIETKNSCTFKKEFVLDIQNDKVYLIQISSPDNILELQLNNSVIVGTKGNDNKLNYNITEQLKSLNTIKLTKSGTSHFEAKLQCINKLFIPNIQLKCKGKSALIELKVKNAFNTEKQGVLEYTLYSAKGKKLHTRETPIFITGNSANRYQQEIQIESEEIAMNGIKVVCCLYSNGKIFDKVSDNL